LRQKENKIIEAQYEQAQQNNDPRNLLLEGPTEEHTQVVDDYHRLRRESAGEDEMDDDEIVEL